MSGRVKADTVQPAPLQKIKNVQPAPLQKVKNVLLAKESLEESAIALEDAIPVSVFKKEMV
jgi:hypothetical protein